MNILMTRIDERLVHGQILASWLRRLYIQSILVIDDDLITDEFGKLVFSMAVPPGVSIEVCSVNEGCRRLLRENDGSPPNTLVLLRRVNCLMSLWRGGYRPEEVNIGCMNAGPARHQLSRDVYASREELQCLRELLQSGTQVYLQTVYAEPRQDGAVLLREFEP